MEALLRGLQQHHVQNTVLLPKVRLIYIAISTLTKNSQLRGTQPNWSALCLI